MLFHVCYKFINRLSVKYLNDNGSHLECSIEYLCSISVVLCCQWGVGLYFYVVVNMLFQILLLPDMLIKK